MERRMAMKPGLHYAKLIAAWLCLWLITIAVAAVLATPNAP
jgi:hypothetical protein